MIVGATPPDQAGGASASWETDTKLGFAPGVTIVGRVGTAEYRNEVTDAMAAGIPPGAAEAAPDTLGGAVAVDRQARPGPPHMTFCSQCSWYCEDTAAGRRRSPRGESP